MEQSNLKKWLWIVGLCLMIVFIYEIGNAIDKANSIDTVQGQ